jgi:NAD(P)H-dependent FMN reductase
VDDAAAGPVRVVLVSGSTRAASTNSAALRTVVAVAPPGVRATLLEGLSTLPAFNPDDDAAADQRDGAAGAAPHPAVAHVRRQLGDSDVVLFCTPEYAGSMPGSLKNLLDWTVGSGELYGKPVCWVNVANPGRGEGALAQLASVLGYVGAQVITSACVSLPVARDAVGADGLVADPGLRARLSDVLREAARAVAVRD